MVGLGAEVMAKDMFCWGVNSFGPLNKINKCKNLACKLSVPGCIGDLLSGACVGTVTALSEDVDAGAKQWVGYPCLQPIPGGLALDALGHWDINGAYAGKLWTICNCKASKSVPGYNAATCAGPLCELFKKPELPSLNFGLPRFGLPDVGRLINAKAEAIGEISRIFQMPNISMPALPQIDLRTQIEELKAFLNGTATSLSAPLREALQSKFPTFSLNLTTPEVPTLSMNIARPDLNLADLLPQLDMSKLGADQPALRVFNMSQLANLGELHTLEGLLKAFNLHAADDEPAAAAGAGAGDA
ncbi:MAG: hypothetical protein J3K34DRAFT_444154 [Monoraphidium minutum]|nr:MAG: hypothetical protein J3K34DRAFT_444154 [Monoraphidium minutum]